MTREEIMAMGERELYFYCAQFAYPQQTLSTLNKVADDCAEDIDSALGLCYQAEEKIASLGLGKERILNLCMILTIPISKGIELQERIDLSYIDCLDRAHPKRRAQAVLLVIGDHQ